MMWLMQQAALPPGRSPQPLPPQVPQDAAQQAPLSDKIPWVQFGSGTTQPGSTSPGPAVEQETLADKMLWMQQPAPPALRLPQPLPPQVPQVLAQQTPVSGLRIPYAQTGSGSAGRRRWPGMP